VIKRYICTKFNGRVAHENIVRINILRYFLRIEDVLHKKINQFRFAVLINQRSGDPFCKKLVIHCHLRRSSSTDHCSGRGMSCLHRYALPGEHEEHDRNDEELAAPEHR
jgi:hypothetical protein